MGSSKLGARTLHGLLFVSPIEPKLDFPKRSHAPKLSPKLNFSFGLEVRMPGFRLVLLPWVSEGLGLAIAGLARCRSPRGGEACA